MALPDQAVDSLADRILAGLLGNAAGDALGLPWEGTPPSDIPADEIELFPAGRNVAFEPYETSDDTALTLLVADVLVERGADAPAAALLERISAARPSIGGIGPSTTAAIGRVARDRRAVYADAGSGATNGAAMRALPIGWAFSAAGAVDRRRCALDWSRTTHGAPDACAAAAVIAACATRALGGGRGDELLDVAVDEARACEREIGARRLVGAVQAVASGTWEPPTIGIGLDAVDTIAAVLSCVRGEVALSEALLRAVRLGGDTDTVAALVGGLLGCRMASVDVTAALPWLASVRLASRDRLERVARGLARLHVGTERSAGDRG